MLLAGIISMGFLCGTYNMQIEIDGNTYPITSNISVEQPIQLLSLAREKIEFARQIHDTFQNDLTLTLEQRNEKHNMYYVERFSAYFDALCHYHEFIQQLIKHGKNRGFTEQFDNAGKLQQIMTPCLMEYLEAAQEAMGHEWLFADETALAENIKTKNPELYKAYSESVFEMLNFMDVRLVNGDFDYNYEILALYYIQKGLKQTMDIYEQWNLKPSDSFFAQRIWDAKNLIRAEVLQGTDYCLVKPLFLQIQNWMGTFSNQFNAATERNSLSVEEKNSLSLIIRASIELCAYSDFLLIEEGENHDPACTEVNFEIEQYPILETLSGEFEQRNLQDREAITNQIINELQNTIDSNPDLRQP